MADFKNKARGFEDPTQLPQSKEEQEEWLKANKEWWEKQPMRYDFTSELNKQEFTEGFYKEIDKRFFDSSKEYAPYKNKPFEGIIDFAYIKDKKVLEIGVGNGSHAQLIASNCKEYTGIDLTEYATKSTTRRIELAGIQQASIIQMNAETLAFPDNHFDYVWSWGVIHHSANTLQILKEINRVLKPGAKATIMVYYRSHWYYYVYSGFFHGILKGYLFKDRSLNKVLQHTIDGAIARFYRIPEWRKVCRQAGLKTFRLSVMGMKNSLVILPPGKFKNFVLKMIPNKVSRFLTNNCRMGYFLVSDLIKPA